MAHKKAIVIGAGVAGLAASVRLAKAGFETHVFEANPFPGGKINSKWHGAYRFDQGPSIFTGPEYVKELYDLCGENFDAFEFTPLNHSFSYFFNDGTRLELSNRREQIISEIAQKLDENPEQLRKYLDKSAKNYKRIAPLFIEKSLHRWRKLIGKNLVAALARIPKYRLYTTMHEENAAFFKNPKTVQIFDRFATYNGSSPYKAPAMLNMISHLEVNIPPFLPKNGMIQITDSIYHLAIKQGVNFHFNKRVDEILVVNQKAVGIRVGEQAINADVVFSNMDVAFTYEKLLPNEEHPTKILAQERSSSAVVFYWGINRAFPELKLHNIFFTDNYSEEFAAIFESKTLYEDPTIYINITSKHVPEDAPEDHENWFVMINAPINTGQNWDALLQEARKILIQKLSDQLGCNIEQYIVEEAHLDPTTIEERYAGKAGSIYGNASNNRFAAFYRHANFSKQLKGLYFVGVSVHPGGGIPLALNSAKIAVECMQDDRKK